MTLTPLCCSVHTHSTLCDGTDTPAAMAAAACASGVRYFGLSGHSHTAIPADAGQVLPADLTEYRGAARGLQREYAGRMEILLGIEQDFCADCPVPADADYWIGSVHDLRDRETGEYYAVDWKKESLAACCVRMFRGDFSALVRQYYADVAAAAAQRPTILGHIDLITKLNGDGELFDEDDRHYRAAALSALRAADPAATLLEVNTGAMSRKYRKTPYPAQFILREWRNMGGRIILTSDAHRASDILYGYADAAAWAKAAGFAGSVVLTGAGAMECVL